MSKSDEIYFKARIDAALDDAIKILAIELGCERSEAGRDLMRRGANIHVAPIIVRPHWTDDDLSAIGKLRTPAHENYLAAKELRSLVDELCGDDKELRKKIAVAVNRVYAEYVAIKNIRDALTGLTPEEIECIQESLVDLDTGIAEGNPKAAALAKLVRKLGF